MNNEELFHQLSGHYPDSKLEYLSKEKLEFKEKVISHTDYIDSSKHVGVTIEGQLTDKRHVCIRRLVTGDFDKWDEQDIVDLIGFLKALCKRAMRKQFMCEEV